MIDFSANHNPLGTAPAVLEALRSVEVGRYPDDEALELRQALGRALEMGPDRIAVGNGSVDLMWQVATAFLDPGDPAMVVGPAFGEYERACRVVGAQVEEVRAQEDAGFRPPVAEAIAALRRMRPKVVFLGNPNNPTGQLLPASSIEQILEVCRDTLLVVDEAYLPFCDAPPDLRLLLSSGRLMLLRSMTKDHGLAGLRLGYALAEPEIVDALNRVRQPWGVNVVAQMAGVVALEHPEHVEAGRRIVAEAREYVARELTRMGLTIVPSAANFLLVRVGDGATFRAALLERGVCVRDCASFGLPDYVRLGLRTVPECRKLVETVGEVLRSG